MKHQVVIYEWPESQNCMDCEHGKFIEYNNLPSTYACELNCPLNDETECFCKIEKEELK